jgi:phosphatidate phosphatase PAH1
LKVIREATTSTVQKTNDANTKRVEQASKKEPKTSGGAPNTGNSHQSVKEKAAAMQKQLGRRLTQDEILAL